ncbi:MAG: hypothetical protein U5K56_20295 [Halioglobus sp.]|nr:hypothetical protein [Halioglobus sp.]
MTVIVFVRSAYEHCYSKYGQSVKRDGASHAFGEGRTDLTGWTALDRLVNYSRIFLDNLRILNYDDAERDIFTAFAAATGIDLAATRPLEARINRSLTFAELKVLRQINALHDGAFATAISDHLIESFPEREPRIFYDESLVAQLREEHGSDVEWINRHFAVKPPLVVDHFSGQVNAGEEESADNTWAAIVAWARKHKPPRHKLGAFGDLLVALAEQVRDSDPRTAAALSKRARRCHSRQGAIPSPEPPPHSPDKESPDKESAEPALRRFPSDLLHTRARARVTRTGSLARRTRRLVTLHQTVHGGGNHQLHRSPYNPER